jgi:hypothetical protein
MEIHLISISYLWHFSLLLFIGKYEGTFYWHGRDNMTIRELNAKVNTLLLALLLIN